MEYNVKKGYIPPFGLYRNVMKRIFDFILALIGTPFLLLAMIIVGVLIKTEDGGSIFYISERLGKDGTVFRMYKFRSMRMNAETIFDSDGLSTIKGEDPRVTKIGRLIRKTGIDELPQLINILKGDMSFIGPRPDLPTAVDTFSGRNRNRKIEDIPDNFFDDYYKVRMAARPGLTCYGPVMLLTEADRIFRDIIDAWYVQNISLKMDALIVVKTAQHIIAGRHL